MPFSESVCVAPPTATINRCNRRSILNIDKIVSCVHMLHEKYIQKKKFLVFMCISVVMVAGLSSGNYFNSANAQKKTTMETKGTKNTITNATKINIVLVHGLWADASSWSKVIPILQDAGHK